MATALVEAPRSLLSPLETSSRSINKPLPDIVAPHEYKGPRMYQLLGLVAERGSSGVVDKVIITDQSIGELVSLFKSDAYESISKIDFATLDQVLLKPLGVYGSESALTEFLRELGVNSLAQAASMARRSGYSKRLPTGLYFIPATPDASSEPRKGYVIYWPEPTTWDDDANGAVKRNRITFMRYLTKIAHQVVALMAPEYSRSIIWKQPSSLNSSKNSSKAASRWFSFGVQKSHEQAESVHTRPGSMVAYPDELLHEASTKTELAPRLVSGHSRQALLSGKDIPSQWLGVKDTRTYSSFDIRDQLRAPGLRFDLDESVDMKSANLLLDRGLEDNHLDLRQQWREDVRAMAETREARLDKLESHLRSEFSADFTRLKTDLKVQILRYLQAMHRWSGDAFLVDFAVPPPKDTEQPHHELVSIDEDTLIGVTTFRVLASSRFQALKARFIVTSSVFESSPPGALPMTPSEYKALDKALVATRDKKLKAILGDKLKENALLAAGAPVKKPGFFSKLAKKAFRIGPSAEHVRTLNEQLGQASTSADIPFLDELASSNWDSKWREHLPRTFFHIRELAVTWLKVEMERFVEEEGRKISEGQLLRARTVMRAALKEDWERAMEERYRIFRAALNAAEKERVDCESLMVIHSFRRIQSEEDALGEYTITETTFTTHPPHVEYCVQPIGLTSHEVLEISADTEFIPNPIVLPNGQWTFRVREGSKLELVHLFPNGKYLVIISHPEYNQVGMYLESDSSMASAIIQKRATKRLDLIRLGDDFVVSVDEVKNLVGFVSKAENRLAVYVIDEHFSTIQNKVDVDLRLVEAVGKDQTVEAFAFIPGKEEVVLLDTLGSTRILSLITRKVKTGTHQLRKGTTYDILPSPDASCIFFAAISSNEPYAIETIQAVHTASFGTTKGFDVDVSAEGGILPQLTYFGPRTNVYLVFSSPETQSLRSIKIQVITRTSDFSIRARQSYRNSIASVPEESPIKTMHNSLLDVHSDVWSRFPVQATIQRSAAASQAEPRSISFVSERSSAEYEPYIRNLVQKFKTLTSKPTGDVFSSLIVNSYDKASFVESLNDSSNISTFPAGRWLIELVCLIPLHLAITDGDRFVPLKDGVWSTEFDRSLLGLNTTQVSKRLTLGWYESILESYYADKPVRVVSSMGEQSVGKSYALNHFVDTSFAGSAMRCTEGAWMSVTPTDDELVIALDFEGIHSLERSAQEDMLLVLFNVALSNMVLFRNNFALSRDIAGLFTSFQNSASLLGDPTAHPTLFQSTLAIIIKDVVDTDSEEIAKEFAQKFTRIVRDTQGKNFISTLHRGQLDIIPWPVIQSEAFYSQMLVLQQQLKSKPVTHVNAATFLETTKVLMARLKASDWGSLDASVAEGRVNILVELMPQALLKGYTGENVEDGQLKNIDLKEPIPPTESDHDFVLYPASDQTVSLAVREAMLQSLLATYQPDDGSKRQQVSESTYLFAVRAHLGNLAKQRAIRVKLWLKTNLARFSREQPEVQKLWARYDTMWKDILAGVEVCGKTCAKGCELVCLRPKMHDSLDEEHNCGTDHKCLGICAFDHGQDLVCGYPAGHSGRHICNEKAHLCGQTCSYESKQGCKHRCAKNANHEGGEHVCNTNVHMCGEICWLGSEFCQEPCAIDCRKTHTKHACRDILKCPVKCALCDQLCATPNHEHALVKDAIHLCGREHPCKESCNELGMCDVSPTAATAMGRTDHVLHVQTPSRRPCVRLIPAYKLAHKGTHSHSLANDAFHFCGNTSPFPGCGGHCVCELPFGHTQMRHSTGHGLVEQQTWAVAPNEVRRPAITSRRSHPDEVTVNGGSSERRKPTRDMSLSSQEEGFIGGLMTWMGKDWKF